MTLLDGKALSIKIKEELKEKNQFLKSKGIESCLAVILVGDNAASQTYVNSKAKDGDEIYGKVTADTGGGSAYLTSVEVSNPIELILFGPIKQIYLLFSPMPWLIRGVMDIATLLFDSSLYMYMAYLALKNFKHIESNIKTILLSFIIGTFIFGLGSLNTGTAIRHKNKLQSMMLYALFHQILSYLHLKNKYFSYLNPLNYYDIS